jgi:DNA uptake protein ComE-like DNA-binding protein
MRRIVGAWFLFCLIAVPGLIRDAVDLSVNRLPADRQDVPVVNVLPVEKTASVSQQLPPRFLSEPLVFFSTAPPESLALLPGIGPVLAARIRDDRGGKRPFKDWEDLLLVKGIGKKTVAKLRRLAGDI